ncbi:hypothetical protein DFA_08028 [Cavenderia fasciculata]|uniref:Uncharacterized protein n=1 Tax=Cavenderia fasciculata TaxID=261658 RepID=F4Q4N8_CACFS|nr:uncharacterized protein DFA_08028 [Cavenderia fasciculata]EGG17047.1 hypothetical protein DFA_08028 [Cavenderia fasciculata]|eukprot:XP_004355531.1 hypothetical protein DFA_08028 [Cavenderia fasciculata]
MNIDKEIGRMNQEIENICKELIGIGIKAFVDMSKYDKILFVGSIALPVMINLPNFGIIPNDESDRIETHYLTGIDKIAHVYDECLAGNDSILETKDIKLLAASAQTSDKLCRILARRDVVLMLLQIIINAESMWRSAQSFVSPLSEETIHNLYLTLDYESLMLDASNLLNHILPKIELDEIPFGELIGSIRYYGLSTPIIYKLLCAILKLMVDRNDTVKTFMEMELMVLVRYFMENEFKSEYRLLRDYWLQISVRWYRDRFKLNIAPIDRMFIEEYYQSKRFWIYVPKEIRVNPHGLLSEVILDGYGFLRGYISSTSLLIDYIYSESGLYDICYRKSDTTLTRFLFSSFFATSMLMLFTFSASRKGKVHYIISAAFTCGLTYAQEIMINRQKTGGRDYKIFKDYFTQNTNNDIYVEKELLLTQDDQQTIIHNRSDILDYEF